MDGFATATGRVIYSLAFEIEALAEGIGPSQLIAPLDAHGNGRYARPVDRRRRLADVGPGEEPLPFYLEMSAGKRQQKWQKKPW